MSQKWPILILSYDPNTLCSPDSLKYSESQHPGFSVSVKIWGAQSNINSELLFKILCSKTWVREKKLSVSGEEI